MRGRTAWVIWLALVAPARAEDVVLVTSATDPAAPLKKSGQVLEFTGVELTLKTAIGVTERIPTSRVLDLQTDWTPSHEAGRAARLTGELAEAIAKFQAALTEEKRGWARRQIAADLTGAYLESGRVAHAVAAFLPIVASDPHTPHYKIAPIAWRAAAPDFALDTRAAAWLGDQQSERARLIGASWLLPGGQRAAATAELERLASSSDARVAALATMQLWRTKLVTAKPEETRRWRSDLDKSPAEVQACGWYILGETLARQNDPEAAALAYLKIPLLFREHRPLAADALLAAGGQLEALDRTTQAVGLYRELTRDFGHLPAADEAQARLAKLTPAPDSSAK